MIKTSSKKLASLLWRARTMQEVEQVIQFAENQLGATWHPVGDRENNIGTIAMASDPGLSLLERVSNMIDAMLELGHAQHPKEVVSSPREAAEKYFSIPPGGVVEMSDEDCRKLAECLCVSLEDSGREKHPSVVIEDRGIGETAQRFPKTLLSLNESNKVSRPWTMGTYGQGGSTTFGFSEATIILSRRHPDFLDGDTEHVAWTLVKKNYDASKMKVPRYEYLVDANGDVFQLSPQLFSVLNNGTRITHIEYDLQISGPFTTKPYQFFNAALFEPVLPFTLAGNRYGGKEASFGTRPIKGNAARLHPIGIKKARGSIDLSHSDKVRIDLGEDAGSTEARIWVLRRPADSKSKGKGSPAESYVKASEAISITLHGQRQDTEGRSWVRRNTALTFLFKNIIVQVDATGLSEQAKAELFSSTRERGRKSEIRSELYSRIADLLKTDPDLKALNHQEKERMLERSTASANRKISRKLGRFIKDKLKNLSRAGKGILPGTKIAGGAGLTPGTKYRSGTRTKPRDKSDTNLPNDPTKFSFERKSILLRQGERAHVNVEINAKNEYLPVNDMSLDIKVLGGGQSKVRVVTRSALMGGQCRWTIEADEDAPLGGCTLTAELITPGRVLRDTLAIEIKKKRQTQRKKDGGNEPETGPDVRWVKKENWPDGWDGSRVGEVHEDGNGTTILINRNFAGLDASLKGRKLTEAMIETRTLRYQFPVACGLWMQHYEINEMSNGEARPSGRYQITEQKRMADAVLAAIDPDVALAGEENGTG